MVQRNTEEKPIVSPVTVDVSLLTLEADPDPDIVDHVPVSLTLVELAARVVVVTPHKFWSVPAAAMVVVESEVIVTSLAVAVHPPFADVIVHLSTVVSPMVSPVTADVSLFTLDAAPVPETVVHVPVSEAAAALAANVPEVVLQRFCVDPAAATVIAGSTVIVTSLVVGAQPPNPDVIVHLSTVVSPIVSPVTADVSLLTLDAVPVPENVVHVPVSAPATALAARVPDVVLQRFCTGPASAIVVVGSTLIVTSLMVGAHPPFAEVMVHLSTVVPPIVSPVTAEDGSLTEEAVPVPDSVVHVPVSLGLGVLAAMVVVVTLHRSWVGPPAAAVVAESTVMVTSEVVTAHPPLTVVMVHLKIEVSPMESPVTPDVGSLISVTIAEPERTAHPPESVPDGVFAASVAVMILQRF
jgi:hypothetical protein